MDLQFLQEGMDPHFSISKFVTGPVIDVCDILVG